VLLVYLYLIGCRRRQWMLFRPPLLPANEPNFNKTQRSTKLFYFYFNLLNQLNRFDSGIGKNMWKAAHPLGGMNSSNSRRWRGERLQHHGEVVGHVVCAFCAVSSGRIALRVALEKICGMHPTPWEA
jgi:hypothetical protein